MGSCSCLCPPEYCWGQCRLKTATYHPAPASLKAQAQALKYIMNTGKCARCRGRNPALSHGERVDRVPDALHRDAGRVGPGASGQNPALSHGERVARVRRLHQPTRAGLGGTCVGKQSCSARLSLRKAVILSSCASQLNASANCGATKPKLKKRHGMCCAVEGWARSFAANAASKTGLSISIALNIDWRSSSMAVFILSRAKCGKTLRRRII